MNWSYYNNENTMAHQAFLWCQKKISEYNAKSIFIPAGSTPIPLYTLFESKNPNWLNNKILIQIDDILNGEKKGLFYKFFQQHLPNHISQISRPQVNQFEQGDLTILGLGVNGHIAFHEPHLESDFKFGEVSLAQQTRTNLKLSNTDTAISYGAQAFLKSKAILLIISGNTKKEITKQLINGYSCPASLLFKHKDITIFCTESLKPK